jgi:EAL domain-containing protein (putative c-di-GMP-specific phosphodiesterase class I)
LRDAIENDEFVLHYQPRVDCVSGALRGLEALLRWQRPGRGLVPPAEFVPLAEESDMANELGKLVIRRVCQQLAQWKEQGLQLPPVSVNISPRHFAVGGVHAHLVGCMKEFGLARGQLEIEITESSMMESGGQTEQELASLRREGVPLLVDDFGIGHSSLSQLQNLQVDMLKIDRSFIQRVADDVRSEAMCMAIISMAHVLDMQVVAEGVETPEQLDVLRQLACNQVQGFLVSRPVTAEQLPALLARERLLEPAPERQTMGSANDRANGAAAARAS